MKRIFTLLFLLISITTIAQERIAFSDTSRYYQFEINYWFNMHHFLWLEAFMNHEMDSSLVGIELNKPDKNKLEVALQYYKDHLVSEDLRMSDYQTEFKKWITSENTQIDISPEEFKNHVDILKSFSKTYQTYFWQEHFEECKKVLDENLSIIRSTEKDYVDAITKLTRQFWDFERIKVDLTFYAKSTKWNLRNRAYTSIFPTHVVMNASGENEIKGNWIEVFYHESAHHLILTSNYFIGGTINDVAEVKGLKTPRQLWHAILFYLTGEVSKKLLTEQGIEYPQTYMQRNNVFSSYHSLLEKHFRPYLERKVTLANAIEDFSIEASEME